MNLTSKNILIDITHPAHYHFFKNPIKILKEKNFKITITVRDKDIAVGLLEKSGLDYTILSKQKIGIQQIIGEMFERSIKLYEIIRKEKIDVVLSIGGSFNVHVCKLLSVPSVVFTDTEDAFIENFITFPFSERIITPKSFLHDLGKKQTRYDGHHELSYLHPSRFTPEMDVHKYLNINSDTKYVIIRLVSWSAIHDSGYSGMSKKLLLKLINLISKKLRVFISSENPLPDKLVKYRLDVPVEKIHHILYSSELYIGESPTMAIESSLMGTPSIGIVNWAYNSGVFKTLSEAGILTRFKSDDEDSILSYVNNFTKSYNFKERDEFRIKAKNYSSAKTDIPNLVCELVERINNI